MKYSDRVPCSVITAAGAAWQGSRQCGGAVHGVGLPHPAGSAVLPCSSVLLLWSWTGLVVAAPELQT